jgi:hypothetical protein
MFIDKKNEKIEYSITGNDVVPQNMIGDFFLGHPVCEIFGVSLHHYFVY